MTCKTISQASTRTGITAAIITSRLTVKLQRKDPKVYSTMLDAWVLFRKPGKTIRKLRPLTPEEAEQLKQKRDARRNMDT